MLNISEQLLLFVNIVDCSSVFLLKSLSSSLRQLPGSIQNVFPADVQLLELGLLLRLLGFGLTFSLFDSSQLLLCLFANSSVRLQQLLRSKSDSTLLCISKSNTDLSGPHHLHFKHCLLLLLFSPLTLFLFGLILPLTRLSMYFFGLFREYCLPKILLLNLLGELFHTLLFLLRREILVCLLLVLLLFLL